MGIVVSIFADAFFKYRTFVLAGSLVLWSLMTFLTGFATQYWQLVIFRFGLGIGQAGCNPIATSIIADYFSMELRGSALSVYNWGIYVGYAMSIAIGNLINEALVRTMFSLKTHHVGRFSCWFCLGLGMGLLDLWHPRLCSCSPHHFHDKADRAAGA